MERPDFYIVQISTTLYDESVDEEYWETRYLQDNNGDLMCLRSVTSMSREVQEEVERMGYTGFEWDEFYKTGIAHCANENGEEVTFTALKVGKVRSLLTEQCIGFGKKCSECDRSECYGKE